MENLIVDSPKPPSSTYFKSRDATIDLGGVGAYISVRIRL